MGNLELLTTNVAGFVRQVRNKISGSNYLFPVFEALINSIQAVNDDTGIIHINIIRSETQLTIDESKPKDPNIVGYEIIDNGIGFDENNYNSFKSSYSEHKIELGCKGIGRFVGLAAFRKMEVNSVFKNTSDGLFYRRTFTFTEKGIESPLLEKVEATETKTIVNFSGIHEKFIKNTSPKEVNDHLLKHILVYFVTGNPPKILVSDSAAMGIINLNELFNEVVSVEDDFQQLNIKSQTFDLYFLKTYFKNFHKHLIHYCGNKREVKDVVISSLIPKFVNERIPDENGKTYFLSIYVTGSYLNENVEDFRNAFTFPTKKAETSLYDIISLEELNENISSVIKERYSSFIEEQNKKIMEETSTYIYTEAREYEYLLSHPELLTDIKPNSSREDIELQLHRANYEFARRQKAKVNHFLTAKVENTQEYKENLQEILNNQNEIGKSNLVKYMLHRKAVLKLLEKFLNIQKTGDYKKEADVHDILFERKKTNNQLSLNEHNLWILDERLAYSQYITSDLHVGDTTKPDIFIYDKKFVFGNIKENIVIFELKRPGRTNYTEEEKDFGKQIFKQVVDMINSGGGKDENGRNLNINASLPKFGFVIADMDNNVIEYHNLCGYKTTPKGSLFKYEQGINMFIEIMTYDQLKEDANLRHKAFFSHLGIDGI